MVLEGAPLVQLALLIVLGMGVQTATGFGSNLVIISVGLSVLPLALSDLIAVILPLGITQSLVIAAREHEHARRKLLIAKIFPWMGAGVMVGFGIALVFTGTWLKLLLGVFFVGVSLSRLHELIIQKTDEVVEESQPDVSAVAWYGLFLAGVFHGLYATAGPALVWALARARLTAAGMRSTLAFVWLVMNAILGTGLLLSGKMQPAHIITGLALLPCLGAGYLLGDLVHRRLPERLLRALIYAMLGVAGAVMVRGVLMTW